MLHCPPQHNSNLCKDTFAPSVSSLSFPHPFRSLCRPARSFAQALSSLLLFSVFACSSTPFRLYSLLFNCFVLRHLVAFYRFFLSSSSPLCFLSCYVLDIIFNLFTLVRVSVLGSRVRHLYKKKKIKKKNRIKLSCCFKAINHISVEQC